MNFRFPTIPLEVAALLRRNAAVWLDSEQVRSMLALPDASPADDAARPNILRIPRGRWMFPPPLNRTDGDA